MPGKTTVTLEGDRELAMSRVFDAPRERVFKAWTDPEALMRWWGPRTWPTKVCTIDLRPGGVWHYCMVGPEGEESWGRGEYTEILPPERLVYIDTFSNAAGEATSEAIVITLEFKDQGSQTLLVSRSLFESAQHRDTVMAMGMEEGMTETLDRLDEYLAA